MTIREEFETFEITEHMVLIKYGSTGLVLDKSLTYISPSVTLLSVRNKSLKSHQLPMEVCWELK